MGANIITDAQRQKMPTVDCLLQWADIGTNTFRRESTRNCNHQLAKNCKDTCHRCEYCHHEAALEQEDFASVDDVAPTPSAVRYCAVAARQHQRERQRSEPGADCSARPLLLDRTRVGENPDLVGDVDPGAWPARVLKTFAPADSIRHVFELHFHLQSRSPSTSTKCAPRTGGLENL